MSEFLNKITIGLPCLNEEKNITKTYRECISFIKKNKIKKYEVLIIDNKSSDNTVKILKKIIKKKNTRLIINTKNIFYSGSVEKIIFASKYNNIAIVDSDGQYYFSDLKKLFSILFKNNDIVFGYRKKRKDNFFRVLFSKIFNLIAVLLLGSCLNDLNCGIRVLKRNKNFKKNLFKLNYVNPELYCFYKSNNLKIAESQVNHKTRIAGESIHGNAKIFFIFLEILKYFIKLRQKYL